MAFHCWLSPWCRREDYWERAMNFPIRQEQHDWARYKKVIVFDGVCNFCNAFVDFVMRHDPHGKFKFGTLQSEPAQKILDELGLQTKEFETFLLLEDKKVYTKSTAALKIAKELRGLWPFLAMFLIIPLPIRDWIYDYVARRRYRWMGKRESCRLPIPKDRERFV
jgi:predicted DCC family thiol-disulfide oxidoreductase YuxK